MGGLLRFVFITVLALGISPLRAGDTTLVLKKVIRGNLASKSVVHSGNGLFFAQNMMYKHTISIFNRAYLLVKTIPDQVQLADYGISEAKGTYKGAPVEAAFTHKGKYAWVSNYQMWGDGFVNPGCDSCMGGGYDESYLYRINTENFEIEKVIKVGSVPKYVAACDNNKYVLVSNWSSGDVSVIDVESNSEIKRIKAGAFPRGIAIDSKSKYAYVAIMGGTGILKIDLDDFSTSWIREVGRAPRHLCISSNDSVLYVSLNTEGKIARINLNNNAVDKISCAGAPRSMTLSPDDHFLYVVNYSADKVSKIDLELFRLVEQQNTHGEPIGITFDEELKEIWVACYSGSIMVFADKDYNKSFDLSWIMDGVTGMYDRFSDFTGSFLAAKKTKPGNKKEVVMDPVKTKKQDPAPKIKDDESAKEKVRPEPVKTMVENTTPVKGEITPAAGEIYVVVGSFKVEGNAYRLKNRLTDKGYTSVVFRNKNGMMCTALGAFGSVQSAQEALNKVKLVEKMDGWILKVD